MIWKTMPRPNQHNSFPHLASGLSPNQGIARKTEKPRIGWTDELLAIAGKTPPAKVREWLSRGNRPIPNHEPSPADRMQAPPWRSARYAPTGTGMACDRQ